MEDSIFLTLTQNMLILVLVMSAPVLIISMIVGLIISIFQAVTQIQESTLTFVPKIITCILVLILTLPWLTSIFISRTNEMFEYVQQWIR